MLKGKACINCRRRKIKCDGERPSCGQCARSNGAFEDCEYPGTGPTQTQMLEDRISHLQNRIRQLENQEDPINVSLHNPYSKILPKRDADSRLSFDCDNSNSRSSSSSQSPPSRRRDSSSPASVQEPPMNTILLLINTFYQHCSRFGFFLNIERFHQSLLLQLPFGHHSRPTPALLNAVYLWGVHLSPTPLEGLHEKALLRDTLHYLSSDLSSSHPSKIIHGIQAEVLLSYYYLRHGKVLGGNYHANAAVSLSLSANLHRTRTLGESRLAPTPTTSPQPSKSTLPTAADDVEEIERVNAFWAVLILNNYWIAIQECHSMFYDLQDIGVETPWPMDVAEYQLLLPRVNSGTIKRFLECTSIEGFSITALHAKASVLLEQATVFRGLRLTDTSTTTAAEHVERSNELTRLDVLVDDFKGHFPMIEQMDVKPSESETLTVMQMMTHVATIKLHLHLSDKGNVRSRQKVLIAAQSVAVLTHNMTSSSAIGIDPIIGVLWTAACEVFIHELLKVDSIASGNNPRWSTLLHSILSHMNKFSVNSVFMKFLLNRLQRNHPAALTYW